MFIRWLILSSLLIINPLAQAATVMLGVDDSVVTILGKTAEARYRLSQTNWDQTIFNGTNFDANNIVSNHLGNAMSLDGKTWIFSLVFERGDSGARGLTFNLTDAATGMEAYELVYDTANPINGQTPLSPFNGIKIETRAGALRDSTSTAALNVSNLTFGTTIPVTGSLPTTIDVYSPPTAAENWSSWLIADTNLGDLDWFVIGTVTGQFDCTTGGADCLRDESIKLNFKLADVSLAPVPIPAAAWLFASGLLGLISHGCCIKRPGSYKI